MRGKLCGNIIQLAPPTIKAIESLLSKGDRAVVIPLKDGGVRVNHEMSKTVYLQKYYEMDYAK